MIEIERYFKADMNMNLILEITYTSRTLNWLLALPLAGEVLMSLLFKKVHVDRGPRAEED